MTQQFSLEDVLRKNDWPLEKIGELTIVKSPLLSKVDNLVHGFTTRLGGTSKEPLNWFNLGRHVDNEEIRQEAMQNRKILCRVLSLNDENLAVPGQKHTNNIYVVENNFDKNQVDLSGVDGLITQEAKQPLLLHFADCVPIILFDPNTTTLAILHAGWRGTASGIASKAVDALVNNFSCKAKDILVAVGPAIGSCCYEVGEEVIEALNQSVKSFNLVIRRNASSYPELASINALQLRQKGVEKIDIANWCTSCHPELFYSHRYAKGKTGRQGAIAAIL